MTVAEARGLPAKSQTPDDLPASERQRLDQAVAGPARTKGEWARLSVGERLELLDRLHRDFARVAEDWVLACEEAEGILHRPRFGAEEWLAGPYFILRNIDLLRQSLRDIRQGHRPRIPGPVRTLSNGQVSAQVFPGSTYDGIFFPGVRAEVYMQPGVTLESLPQTQAAAYFREPGAGSVSLVLGGGNVSSIGPMDALYKLFVDLSTVVFKVHPVNSYLGPLLQKGFSCLVERGFMSLAYGGAAEGSYLCHHPKVDEIHITGSDKTYEAIVFGPGEEGRQRKARGERLLDKPVSAELGNVSPVIVVPGDWSEGDLAYQADNLVSMLTNNAGFNCNATRVMIQHASWPLREKLLERMRNVLREVPPRKAYYPGAADRFARFLEAHPEAERFGKPGEEELPWAFIPGLDPHAEDDICYDVEAFCSVFGETPIEAADPIEFLDKAVDFANDTLWGTLNITLVIQPRMLRDSKMKGAFRRAIQRLRYGTVAINHWAAIGYGLVVTPWGAYPGHAPTDIQSGSGVVHNTLMFDRVEKGVLWSPFRAWPKPPWFVSHKTSAAVGRALTHFEISPSPLKLPSLFWAALRG